IWLFHLEIKDISILDLRYDADGAQGCSGTEFGEAVLDLDTARALQFQLGWVRYRISWREFILGMGLHIVEEIGSVEFDAYWAESASQIPDKGDMSAYRVGILSVEDFLGTTMSYTLIRDLMLRLCHRLIAYSIAGRSQAPKKVTVTDLFYLRGMDVGSVKIPYLLARLQIYEKLDDTWAWVAPRLERQLVVAASALEVAKGAPMLMRRIARLEKDIHRMRRALGEKREVLDNMAHDFSRFTTWTVTELSRMIDQAGVRYTSYVDVQISYVMRTRRSTYDASTSSPQQPYP
ncbi:hypothetical protein Tco_0931354, partial [Tanacetum coccineum]